jgi:hypothetical protein
MILLALTRPKVRAVSLCDAARLCGMLASADAVEWQSATVLTRLLLHAPGGADGGREAQARGAGR